MRAVFSKVVVADLVMPLVLVLLAGSGLAQEPAKPGAEPAKPGAAKAGASEKKASKQPKGRLPAYYAQIVDDEQRTKIYAIQAKFDEQLAPLRKQLAELEAQRNSEIAAVLTPEQLQKLKQLIDAAKSKRSSDTPPAAKPEAKAAAKPEAAN